jgi:UDP-N-acetylglucosamine 2-epimerase (non-hydrolysing)
MTGSIVASTLKLVGTDEEVIYQTFKMLLEDNEEYEKMSHARNSYGDGFVSKRIAEYLEINMNLDCTKS